MKNNSLHCLECYRGGYTWFFDRPDLGVFQEPFVNGMPQIISSIYEKQNGTVQHDSRIVITFSENQFPGAEALELIKEECNGAWYRYGEREGWLCPVLKLFYPVPPAKLWFDLTVLK
jgi:hypothetical protein